MPSSFHVRFPLSLKPRLYRWPAARAFLIALATSGALWGLAYGWYFSGQPEPGLGFPLVTGLAILAPVAVLTRALLRVRRSRSRFDFDTIVYADSTRVVLQHTLNGVRHELFEAQIHAWVLVSRPAGPGHPVAAPKICCIELISTDGDVLRSEPHGGPARLRKVLRNLGVAFTEEEARDALPG
jgi:hypothetical protein